MPAVPEYIGQGVREFGIQVQLGADGEQLACLLEDEAAREGSTAAREHGGDGAGGCHVGGEGGFEDCEFGRAGEAGGEGDFGEDSVKGAVGGVYLGVLRVVGGFVGRLGFSAKDDGVAFDTAAFFVGIFEVFEVFFF